MKFFTTLFFIAALIAVVSCQQAMNSEKTEQKMRQMNTKEQQQQHQQQQAQENMVGSAYAAPPRHQGPAPAYGPASYAAPAVPAPLCQNAYMFSCSPNLAPVPCVRPSSSYGSAGAYSQYVPQYAYPAEY